MRALRDFLRILFAAVVVICIPGVAGQLCAQPIDQLEELNQQVAVFHKDLNFVDGIPAAQRAVELAEQLRGPGHLDVAKALDSLAKFYQSEFRFKEPEALYKRSLAIREAALGPNHLDVATALDTLAAVYGGQVSREPAIQEYFDQADALYARSLAIRKMALGPDDPEVKQASQRRSDLRASYLNALDQLADTYREKARYSDAEPLLQRIITLNEQMATDAASRANAVISLGDLYHSVGRYAEAEALYNRALEISEKGSLPGITAALLDRLADLYATQGRSAEAEPLRRRMLSAPQENLLADNDDSAGARVRLGDLYARQGRYAEAEPLYKRQLEITEARYNKAFKPLEEGYALGRLANLYYNQGRYAEAEPLYRRELAVFEEWRGADHPDVGHTFRDLGSVYRALGRYAEAEANFLRAVPILRNALGPDHPDVGSVQNHLAVLHFVQGQWPKAADFWRQSTELIIRRTIRNADQIGQPVTSRAISDAERYRYQFQALIKVLHRLSSEDATQTVGLSAEAFVMAQWALNSEAASSMAQMAARAVKGGGELARLVRERQDLVGTWQAKSKLLMAARAAATEQRNPEAEIGLNSQLATIDQRIITIDSSLKNEFPNYAALSSPKPLATDEMQALLRADEAVLLFLDTPAWGPTAEETFIWVVTKTDRRWVRSDLGTPALTREVAALRCGLDAALWDDEVASVGCRNLVKTTPQRDRFDTIISETLPFDTIRAHALYKALFGQVEDLIRDKHLLIVPSGPLTQLPFQVLVTSPPNSDASGLRTHEVGRAGIELGQLSDEVRRDLQLGPGRGLAVVRPLPGGPGDIAGVKAGDVLLSIADDDVGGVQQAVDAIRARTPGSSVLLRLLREGREIEATVTLEATTVQEWIPRSLKTTAERDVQWLVRTHAITVLPAVSSLKALRLVAKPSAATKPMIGFGNPLLDGNPRQRPWEAQWAALARDKACKGLPVQQVAEATHKTRGVLRVARREGHADLTDVRSLMPLPDTADELCGVAKDLKLSPDDIWLGARATETNIKALSEQGKLAQYHVLHLATHGTLAGDISGSSEPGLIFTPPQEATDLDDGYLSASEVAALKLDADWVILSACNTAAGGAQGAEALSGLGRAFIYAGARALLVSHWSVDSAATVKLITSAVGAATRDKTLGRAEALRHAMLAMIDKGETREAHPAYWAPFVVVGEGAAGAATDPLIGTTLPNGTRAIRKVPRKPNEDWSAEILRKQSY